MGSHDNSAPDDRGMANRLISAGGSGGALVETYSQLGYAGRASAPAEPGLDLLQYWRILNNRKWVIIGILAAFVVVGGLRTLMTTPLYTATVRLQIDRNASKVVEGGAVAPVETSDDEFLRTQYELLQSRTMAERVASTLNLGDDESFFASRGFSIVGAILGLLQPRSPEEEPDNSKAARERAAAGITMRNQSVRPIPGSRLVDVSYTDPSPQRAQQVVMAYADAFIAGNLDKRFEANAYAKTFLESKLKELKQRLEESERTLLEFARKEQIVAGSDKSSTAENNLAGADQALSNLISERIKNEQLWKQVEAANAINLPQLLSNSVIEGLRDKRNALTAEYQEKLETFKPSYPAMVQIDNRIKEIDRQLAAEVRTIKQSLKAAYESSLGQEKEMRERIERLRAEVIDLQKRSIEYNILKREVDTSRSLYEGLLQRFKEVDVAGGVGANNVFIVDKAEMPKFPSSPRKLRALLVSIALGLGFGLGAAYVLELLDDTIRGPDEIERILGLATLGLIPRIGGGRTVERELSDPRSSVSEAYRSLCTALQFATDYGLPKTLLVTSAGQGEGKSITSLAIAKHFATMGYRVLLIDADMRNPSLHVTLDRDATVGLSTYLTGGCSPPEAIQPTDIANLDFMASGPLPSNAADLLGGSRLYSLLSMGAEVFDLIVVDGPPVMGLADAPLLSSTVVATAFVVEAGQARMGVVRRALKRLHLARALTIGVVLNKFNARSAGYGHGLGDADYAYGPSTSIAGRRMPQLPRRTRNKADHSAKWSVTFSTLLSLVMFGGLLLYSHSPVPTATLAWSSGTEVVHTDATADAPAAAAGATNSAASNATTDAPSPRNSASEIRVQVGSARSRREAQAIAERLKKVAAAEMKGREAKIDEAVVGNMGTLYHVQVGPFADADEPRTLCGKLRGNGLDCMIASH